MYINELTFEQNIVLNNLNYLHAEAQTLCITKTQLMAAFPCKINQIDFKWLDQALGHCGFVLAEDQSGDIIVSDRHMLFCKKRGKSKSTQ